MISEGCGARGPRLGLRLRSRPRTRPAQQKQLVQSRLAPQKQLVQSQLAPRKQLAQSRLAPQKQLVPLKQAQQAGAAEGLQRGMMRPAASNAAMLRPPLRKM